VAQTRRQFIRRGVTFVGAGLIAPRILLGSSSSIVRAATPGRKLLVIVEMAGGNDGLNTVVPYADQRYYSLRPRIGVPRNTVLELNETVGLHPNLGGLKTLYDQNRLAIVQGVGYPNPDLSHFRSTEIWQTAAPDTISSTGWLGRYLDESSAGTPQGMQLDAISIGYETPVTLSTAVSTGVASIESFENYAIGTDPVHPEDVAARNTAFGGLYDDVRDGRTTLDFIANTGLAASSSSATVSQAATNYVPGATYAADPFSQSLLKIAQLSATDLGTDIYYTSFGSFDTHANQKPDHQRLLTYLSDGLSAFYQDMVAHGRGDDLLVMTFSEFGRRVNDNESFGTDHGTAAPLFVLGNAVRGGIFGDHPSLTDLDDNYNLIHEIDFRAVYATVLRHWMDTDPEPVLGGSFEDLGFL